MKVLYCVHKIYQTWCCSIDWQNLFWYVHKHAKYIPNAFSYCNVHTVVFLLHVSQTAASYHQSLKIAGEQQSFNMFKRAVKKTSSCINCHKCLLLQACCKFLACIKYRQTSRFKLYECTFVNMDIWLLWLCTAYIVRFVGAVAKSCKWYM